MSDQEHGVGDSRTLTFTRDEADLILQAVMLEEDRLQSLEPLLPEFGVDVVDYREQERQKLLVSARSIREKLFSSDSRPVVALSEDQKWLVILQPEDPTNPWHILQRDVTYSYQFLTCRPDTGQSVEDVLAEWLAEHEK